MNLERVLFEIARKDLSAAKRLYKHRNYPQSLFCFQQSVEKANKALGLLHEVIKPEELRSKVGHDPIEIYKKNLKERRAEAERNIKLSIPYPKIRRHRYFREMVGYRKGLVDGQAFIEKLNNENLLRLSYDDLYFLLDQLIDLRKAVSKIEMPENLDEMLQPHFAEYLDFVGAFPGGAQAQAEWNAILQDETKREEISAIIRKGVPLTLSNLFVNQTLYFCALVTLPHASKVRYPFHDTKFNPLKFYNRRLPLVNVQPEFMLLMNKALRQMPALFSKLKAPH